MPNPGRRPGPILEEWDWQRTGACRDADPDLFFPPDSERGPRRAAREAAAKAVCQRCPVRRRCAAHAWPRRSPTASGAGCPRRTGNRAGGAPTPLTIIGTPADADPDLLARRD